MMNLIVDIGNSTIKLAVVKHGEVVVQRCVEEDLSTVLEAMLSDWPLVERAIVSSTRGDAESIAEIVRGYIGDCMIFTCDTPVPIVNGYATPETLGRDRLAAAVAATVLYGDSNVLIVDFGTALTIDLVTNDNTYRGGFISPGMQSRFRALHEHTARLPLCVPSDEQQYIGTTTQSSIVEGVMQGIAFEVEGHIARMRGEYGNLCTIFTGGDAKYFVERIKNTIFVDRNLVFCGLDRILEYNASEENAD